MKRNTHLIISLLFTCLSCSIFTSCSNDVYEEETSSSHTTRVSTHGQYSYLGFGYDVTKNYLSVEANRGQVIDMDKYVKLNGISGILEDHSKGGYSKIYAGATSYELIKDANRDENTKVSLDVGDKPSTPPKSGSEPPLYFSGTYGKDSYFSSNYSYSSKYSFAWLESLKRVKSLEIQEGLSDLANPKHLSDQFLKHIKDKSPKEIIDWYGTHVMTKFQIGGRYKLIYRSTVENTKTTEVKRKTVKSGLVAIAEKVGLTVNVDDKKETTTTIVKDNQRAELFVIFEGGESAPLTFNLEGKMPTPADLPGWQAKVNENNSSLIKIFWEKTYPIYHFIADPVKKEAVKKEYLRYIEASRIKTQEVLPLYLYYNDSDRRKGFNHYLTTHEDVAQKYANWQTGAIEGYILKNQEPGTVPLYEYYNDSQFDHYTTTATNIAGQGGWAKLGTKPLGYIYANRQLFTTELFEYQHTKVSNHYTSTYTDVHTAFRDWKRVRTMGYVYPVH